MSAPDVSRPGWEDEDTPEWTDDQLDRAEFAIGGKVVRPAQGTLTRSEQQTLSAKSKPK